MTINIQTIGSSSSGNCYRINDGKTALLLEAGLPIARIKKAIGFSLSSISGCLISHEHGDHSKAIPDLLKAGIDCYMSMGTAREKGVADHHRVIIRGAGEIFSVGSWRVMPFRTIHDCVEPLGFLLRSDETGEKLLFATDTAFMANRFNGLTHVMVECNYDEESLTESVNFGKITMGQYERIVATHFGLENVVEFLKANDLSRLKEIHLMHLSNGNSREILMIDVIQRLTGVPVYSCCE